MSAFVFLILCSTACPAQHSASAFVSGGGMPGSRTLSNPAIVLFSAKNSAGLFCCKTSACFLTICRRWRQTVCLLCGARSSSLAQHSYQTHH